LDLVVYDVVFEIVLYACFILIKVKLNFINIAFSVLMLRE